MSRFCPSCGAINFGTPFCTSCQKPMQRVSSIVTHESSVKVQRDLTLVSAGFFRRLGAFAIDLLTLSIIADIVRFAYRLGGRTDPGLAQMDLAMSFSTVIFILYFTLLTGDGGQTLGKMLLGIRVVTEDESRIGYGRAFLRSIGYIVSFFFGTFLGFIWALWDRKNQTWHDKIARTIVVKV